MIRLVLISALVALAVARTPAVRPIVPMLDGRIVGGVPADITELPYQVSVQFFGNHLCGGSIISSNKVLTAAHCTIECNAKYLSVRAGSTGHKKGGIVAYVAKICQHPQYNIVNYDNDVSVLVLESNLPISASIQLINLAALGSTVDDGTLATVSGWGTTALSGSLLPNLFKVEVPKVSQQYCKNAHGSYAVPDSMTCYGWTQGEKDSCQGDSGGPLVINHTQVGIVSWLIGCAYAGMPGVYTDLSKSVIRNHIDSC